MFTITRMDVRSAFINGAQGLAPGMIGMIAGHLISTIAHTAYNAADESPRSDTIKTISAIAGAIIGLSAAIYLMPQMTIIQFTGRKLIEMVVVELTAGVVVNWAASCFGVQPPLVFFQGALLGWLGPSLRAIHIIYLTIYRPITAGVQAIYRTFQNVDENQQNNPV